MCLFRAKSLFLILSVIVLTGLSASCSRPLPLGKDFKKAVFYPGDLDAVVVWSLKLTDRGSMDYRPIENGVAGVHEDFVYIGGRSKTLYKLNKHTGKILDKRKMKQEILSKPVVHGSYLYLGTPSGKFYALDRFNLDDIWVYDAKSEVFADPVFDGEYVYIITQSDTVTALNAQTGEFVWEHKEPYHGNLAIRKRAKPLIVDNRLFQGFTNGTIAAFNKLTGEKLWHKSLGKGKRFDDVNASPIYYDGYIYTASFDNGVYSLDAQTGIINWFTEIKSASAPIMFDEKIYLTASETGFYCLNPKSGIVEWKMGFKALFMDHLEGALSEPVIYQNKYLIFTASGTGLYFIDPRNQRAILRFTPGNGITAKPTVDKNIIYTLSNGGYFYAVALGPKRIR